jgi:hypothetical protein
MQRVLMAVFAAGAMACSSGGSTTGGPVGDGGVDGGAVTQDQACSEFAQAFCDVYQKCLPLFVTAGFGDSATCVSRTQKGCPAAFNAPSTSATPASVSACAGSVKNLSCEAIFASTPAACIPQPGGLADGASCSDDAQCKSTWCAKTDDTFCGKCTALSTAGGACITLTKADGSTEKECSRGFSCTMDKCVVPVVSGGTCSDATSCSIGLTCFGGKCVLAGKIGAKCDPEGKTDPTCDFLQGAVCNPATKVCQEIAKATAGQPCGLVGGEYKICTGAGKCVVPTGMMQGTCLAPAIDGAACDATKGPDCLPPAKCITGVCKLPDPTLCK